MADNPQGTRPKKSSKKSLSKGGEDVSHGEHPFHRTDAAGTVPAQMGSGRDDVVRPHEPGVAISEDTHGDPS